MKRNTDFYAEKYGKYLEMRAEGKSLSEIAKALGLKYITVYMWERRGRGETASQRLFRFLKQNGPMPEGELKKHFPKLSETFGRAVARGYPLERIETEMKKGLRVWYAVKGDSRLSERLDRYRELVDSVKDMIRDM